MINIVPQGFRGSYLNLPTNLQGQKNASIQANKQLESLLEDNVRLHLYKQYSYLPTLFMSLNAKV